MKLLAAILVLIAGAFVPLAPGMAQDGTAMGGSAPDAAAVAAWADPLFAKALRERRLSGAVAIVVRDGEMVFRKGYGAADARAGTPVDPARTRFRIGSATKTFTAVAIAQLVQDGVIVSLDDPANRYLKRIQIPDHQGRAITIRELATHRGGFANRTFGIGSDAPYTPMLSAEALMAERVAIVRPPGGRAVYSNYSTALLGVIVEDVTGKPIADFLRHRVFLPLGMEDTALVYGGDVPAGTGVPYAYLPDGSLQPVPYHGINPFFAPVGAIVSTAPDIGRYMSALLAGERGEATPLGLSPARFDELLNRHAGNHPAALGFGTVFMTLDWGDAPGIGHGGDWPGFHSILWLLPEQRTGLFVSLMAEAPQVDPVAALFSPHSTPDAARPVLPPMTNIGVLSDFLRHFFGPGVSPRRVAAGSDIPTAELTGSYRHEYRAYGTMMELLDLVGAADAAIEVRATEGGLMIGGKGPFRPVGGNAYWNPEYDAPIDGSFNQSALWAFSRDAAGTISVVPRFAIDPFVKTGALGNPATYAALLPVLLLISLTGLAAFWRARRMAAGRAARIAAFAGAALVILLPLALMTSWTGDTLIADFLLGRHPRFLGVALVTNLLALAAGVLVYAAVRNIVGIVRGTGELLVFEHLHLTLLAIGALGWLALLWRFNLIGVWF